MTILPHNGKIGLTGSMFAKLEFNFYRSEDIENKTISMK